MKPITMQQVRNAHPAFLYSYANPQNPAHGFVDSPSLGDDTTVTPKAVAGLLGASTGDMQIQELDGNTLDAIAASLAAEYRKEYGKLSATVAESIYQAFRGIVWGGWPILNARHVVAAAVRFAKEQS